MKLLKFRIKNYKSIVDSGDCYFSDKLTILAGKNESGKTSILEALEDFHEDRLIRDEADPVRGDGQKSEVFITFNLSRDDQNEVAEDAGVELTTKDILQVEIYKQSGSKNYFLSTNTRSELGWSNRRTETVKNVNSLLAPLKSAPVLPKFNSQAAASYKVELGAYRTANLSDEASVDAVDKAITLIDGHIDNETTVTKFVKSFVSKKLPYFLLFSSFDKGFPDSIPVSELDSSEWAIDLEQVSSFQRKEIASTNSQKQINHQNAVNAEFTDKFKEYWTQDQICLEVTKNGDTVYFWIREDGTAFKPSQRSQGQQWYLSFYIKTVARISEDKPNVILIDEPGLFLHAKAQKDLIHVLDDHTLNSSYPVVFSTHSPYLITEEHLENVRLVEKVGQKTTILGKIHAHKTADKETLTPVLTAIGLGVNDSITNLDQKENVVVEGPEDVFYLQAFKYLLPISERQKANFINGGGAGNMGIVGSILEGWGCSVYYLFDNDQGKTDGEKHLVKNWKVLPDNIKTITQDDGCSIADVLSTSDFKKYVLENEDSKSALKNSTYITKNKLEKVLLARQFLQKVKTEKVAVDADSKKRIKRLFREIEF